MNELSSLFRKEATSEEQCSLYNLIHISIPVEGQPSVDLYIVDANEDVTYNSILYRKFPCKFTGFTQESTGEVTKASLVVANPDRVFQAYMEDPIYNYMKKAKVTVKKVYEKFLDGKPDADTTAYIEDVYLIDASESSDTQISFSLDGVVDLQVKLPRGRFNATSCRWSYKDPDTCGYEGDLPTCAKDLTACKAHGREAYFGGFIGVPASGLRRIYL